MVLSNAMPIASLLYIIDTGRPAAPPLIAL
jgi:hypothetical protein